MSDDIVFRQDFDCWWPVYDKNPEACHKRVTTRVVDLKHTIAACRAHDACVQAGGHAGYWPMALGKAFQRVFTFEPDPALYRCMERNLARHREVNARVSHFNMALGSEARPALMRKHASAGSWRVDDKAGTVQTSMVTIDVLSLEHCDAIILDVEGYEMEVLRGAQNTIAKFRPVIHLEALTGNGQRYARAMDMLGYREYMKVHSDVIYIPA